MLESAKLYIGNVNTNNIDDIRSLAGIAGYALSVDLINDDSRVIRMVWEGRDEKYLHEQMVGAFAMAGFTVKVVSE